MTDSVPAEADRERLGAELAEDFSEWASREGLLVRVSEEQCADLAKAYIAGAVSAAVAAAPHIAGHPAVHAHHPPACGSDLSDGTLWTGDTSRVTCTDCRIALATATERQLLTEAADALWDCAKAALTVKPTLDTPYPDAPEWTPYTRWVEGPARQAHDLRLKIRKHLDTP